MRTNNTMEDILVLLYEIRERNDGTDDAPPMSTIEGISGRIGRAKGTVYPVLQQLVRHGLIERVVRRVPVPRIRIRRQLPTYKITPRGVAYLAAKSALREMGIHVCLTIPVGHGAGAAPE